MDLTPPVAFLFLLLVSTILLHQAGALKLLNVSVPSYIKRGDSARLECRYDNEADRIGSVSWYKDNEHIYSWTKKNNKRLAFEADGVKIDPNRSSNGLLHLLSVTLASTGLYACEVNTDNPPFKVVRGDAYMEVVVPPKNEPKITGEENVYASGDILALNCTSGSSHPAAKLQWFINDYPVKPETELQQPTNRGLYVTRSSLRLRLEPTHVSKEKIEIKCKSTVKTETRVPYLDTRISRIYVQGHASLSRCSTLTLFVVLMAHLLL